MQKEFEKEPKKEPVTFGKVVTVPLRFESANSCKDRALTKSLDG
jgi:hypothetical protein